MKKHVYKQWILMVAALGLGCLIGGKLAKRTPNPLDRVPLTISPSSDVESSSPVETVAKAAEILALDLSRIPPFAGSFSDLEKEAKALSNYRSATVRLSLVLATTDASGMLRLAKDIPKVAGNGWQEGLVVVSILQRWAEVDASAAFAFCRKFPSNRRRSLQQEFINSLAWIDSKTALRFARQLSNSGERSRAISSIASVVARENPEEALRLTAEEGKRAGAWRYHGLFSAWSEDDPEAAYAAAMKLGNSDERSYAMGTVFSNWATNDPEAAHEAALALPKGRERKQALENVLSAWAARDPQSAFDAARSLEGSEKSVFGSVLSNWASTDPAGASAAFATLSSREQRQSVYGIANQWAQDDPVAASAWALSLPSGDIQSNALGRVFSEWAQADGPAAAAALSKVPAHQRMQTVQNVAASWASDDHEAALDWARTLKNPAERSRALISCAGSVNFSDKGAIDSILAEIPKGPYQAQALQQIVGNNQWGASDELIGWLRELPAADRETALDGGSFYSLIEADPKATAALLTESQAALNNGWMWSQVANQLVLDDPKAALKWVDSIEAPALRKSAEISAITAWAQEDREAAFDHARGLGDSKQKIAAVNAIINGWAQEDAEGLMSWAKTATGPERELALLRGSLTLSANDPAASAKVVAGLLSSGGEISSQLEGAVQQVASSWCNEDVRSVCGWVAELPAGKYQDKAIESVAASWAQYDPRAASKWISGMPSGSARDGAVGSLVNKISGKDPESAFVWAASVGDTGARGNLLTNAVNQWTRIDPDAAKLSVQKAELPAELRASLLKIIESSK